MSKADIVVNIVYNINDHSKTVIKTNAKADKVQEILEEWLTSQIGQGRDSREPVRRGEYKITIKLDLSDDTFFTSSDTGNMSLTAGIVKNVAKYLNIIRISPLQ